MQVGVLERERIPDLLRGISQKRRTGVLEIHADPVVREIIFEAGKIVDVRELGVSCVSRVARQLVERQEIEQGEWLTDVMTLAELHAYRATSDCALSDADISFFVYEMRLELLYELPQLSGAHFIFRVEHQVGASELEPVSVGQLLLDYAALEERGAEVRDSAWSERELVRGEPVDKDYSLAEREILSLVRSPMTLRQIQKQTFLSQLTLFDVIDGLIREGSVACSDEQSSGYFEESTPPSSVVADDVSPAIDTPRETYPSLADTLARIAQVVGEHPRAPDWVLILFFTMVCLRIVW